MLASENWQENQRYRLNSIARASVFQRSKDEVMRYVEQSTWEFFIDNAFKYGFEEREGLGVLLYG